MCRATYLLTCIQPHVLKNNLIININIQLLSIYDTNLHSIHTNSRFFACRNKEKKQMLAKGLGKLSTDEKVLKKRLSVKLEKLNKTDNQDFLNRFSYFRGSIFGGSFLSSRSQIMGSSIIGLQDQNTDPPCQ